MDSLSNVDVGAPRKISPSVDNAVVTSDGVNGEQQNTGVTIDDSNNVDTNGGDVSTENGNVILGTGQIGTSTPSAAIDIKADGDDSTKATISTILYSDSASPADAGYLCAGRMRGTKASPDYVDSGDSIAVFCGATYDGTTTPRIVQALRVAAAENHSASALGTEQEFYVIENGGTTIAVGMTLEHDKTLDLAGNLDVNGNDIEDGGVAIASFTGTKTFRLADAKPNYIDFNFNPNSLGRTNGSRPDLVSLASSNIEVAAFAANSVEEVSGCLELNHMYKEGTDIEAHVHWKPTSTNTGSVVWAMDYIVLGLDDVASTSTTITVTDAADGTAWKSQYASIGTIPGTGRQIGDQLHFRFYRLATDAADTYTADATTGTIGFHVEVDSLGSNTVLGKT